MKAQGAAEVLWVITKVFETGDVSCTEPQISSPEYSYEQIHRFANRVVHAAACHVMRQGHYQLSSEE